jgi:hypothetical protein
MGLTNERAAAGAGRGGTPATDWDDTHTSPALAPPARAARHARGETCEQRATRPACSAGLPSLPSLLGHRPRAKALSERKERCPNRHPRQHPATRHRASTDNERQSADSGRDHHTTCLQLARLIRESNKRE